VGLHSADSLCGAVHIQLGIPRALLGAAAASDQLVGLSEPSRQKGVRFAQLK